MKEKIQNLEEEYLPFRYNRIKHHFRILDKNIEITNKTDKEILSHLDKISNHIIKKIKLYGKMNSFFYFAIYFSFFSIFFNDIIFLSSVAEVVGKLIGVLGTTVFLFAAQFVKKIVELYYQDLDFISSHRIAIYSKYQKEKVKGENFSEKDNSYNSFLQYFRERYKLE